MGVVGVVFCVKHHSEPINVLYQFGFGNILVNKKIDSKTEVL
jgi:hypothetical protein